MNVGGFRAKRARQRWSPHTTKVHCGECSTLCKPTKGEALYPAGHAMHAKNFYVCPSCDARVTCHLDTWAPMGVPANAETRYWRNQAHQALDPLWMEQHANWGYNKASARIAVYRWMAKHLGVLSLDFHIGKLDKAQCQKVVELSKAEYEKHGGTSA